MSLHVYRYYKYNINTYVCVLYMNASYVDPYTFVLAVPIQNPSIFIF